MHRQVAAGQVSAVDVQRWKQQIQAINEGVTPPAKAFSDALGEGSAVYLAPAADRQSGDSPGVDRAGLAAYPTSCWLSAMPLPRHWNWKGACANLPCRSIGDGVIATDVDGAIAYMNPAAEQLTHWSASQAIGLPLSALFSLLDEEAQAEGFTLIEHILSGRLSSVK